jgi:23S rRNA (cytidine1920-2'-O)/16S rRNA (cytidine1409-2'-O)-methyltransferase
MQSTLNPVKPVQSPEKNSKCRLDHLLYQRGFAESSSKAKALILSGVVLVDGMKVERAGSQIKADADIVLTKMPPPFVSRGGLKLEKALTCFEIDTADAVVMDVGASTGGFTDCLLKRGAARVYAIDVGYGQLAWSLRKDSRVIVLERQNIRHLPSDAISEELDLVTIDVSFISLEKVIPHVLPYLKHGGLIIALIKPQFEVGKGRIGKGGIVRDDGVRQAVVDRISSKVPDWGLAELGLVDSPITGQKGNIEYLICLQK